MHFGRKVAQIKTNMKYYRWKKYWTSSYWPSSRDNTVRDANLDLAIRPHSTKPTRTPNGSDLDTFGEPKPAFVRGNFAVTVVRPIRRCDVAGLSLGWTGGVGISQCGVGISQWGLDWLHATVLTQLSLELYFSSVVSGFCFQVFITYILGIYKALHHQDHSA